MRRIIFLLSAVFISITFLSCDEENLRSHGLTANAGSDKQVPVGQVVVLNSSGSIDDTGEGFTSQWSFSSVPEGSEVTIEDIHSGLTNFIPDVIGEYQVQLTISNSQGQSSDNLMVNATAPETQELSGTHGDDVHLTKITDNPDIPDYIVTSDFTLLARLTIDPGVRIEVASDNIIRIRNDGVLQALGTEDEPIIITGTNPSAGFWKGILLESSTLENEVAHLHVSGAGSSTISSSRPRSALHLEGARLSVSHSSFTNTDGFGISLQGLDSRVPLNNVEFDQTSLGAMLITAAQGFNIDSQSNFNGQEVVVMGTTLLNTSLEHVLPRLNNGNYRFSATLEVFESLTVESGAIIHMDSDVLWRFRGDAVIRILGTEDDPVIIKGSLEQAGSWRGIIVDTPNHDNSIEYLEIYHAGHSNLMSGFGRAAIGFAGNARAQLSHVYFNDIDGYGIYQRLLSSQIGFDHLSFGNNLTQGAVRMTASQISDVDADSDFGGNYVVIEGGEVSADRDVFWPRLFNGKYLMNGTSTIWGKVTIEPGAIFEFENDAFVRVRTNGVLVAEGTSTNYIVFTKKDGSSAHWKGISIETGSLENSMKYVDISYGGNSSITGAGIANIGLINGARLSIMNSTISHSLGWGIAVHSNATLVNSNNTFVGNVLGDIDL